MYVLRCEAHSQIVNTHRTGTGAVGENVSSRIIGNGAGVARTVACYRSGMNKYELCDHLSEQLFSEIGGYFANCSRSVGSISEETYSQ
jgi:hypothetical protein